MTTFPTEAEAVAMPCAECGETCDPKHRAEYGLWKDAEGEWFALHKWCVEAWMEKHRPRQKE